MLVAAIHGKLPQREVMTEDFLTSAVFSSLRYLGGDVLGRFLRCAITLDGAALSVADGPARFSFWPWLKTDYAKGSGAEPDVIIAIGGTAFVVEAKNYSGKSGTGFATGFEGDAEEAVPIEVLSDQLAREFSAAQMNLHSLFASGPSVRDFALIFLTRDRTLPTEAMVESIAAIDRMSGPERKTARARLYWLSWYRVAGLLKEVNSTSPAASPQGVISDEMLAFLDRQDLLPFTGFNFSPSAAIPEATQPIFFRHKASNYWTFSTAFKLPALPMPLFFRRTFKPYWLFLSSEVALPSPGRIFYGASLRLPGP